MKTKSSKVVSQSEKVSRPEPLTSATAAAWLAEMPAYADFVKDVLVDHLLLAIRGVDWHHVQERPLRKLLERIDELRAEYARKHPDAAANASTSKEDREWLLNAAVHFAKTKSLIEIRTAADGAEEFQSKPKASERYGVDEEFKRLLPPLSPDEKSRQENLWLEEGIRDPLIIWAEENVLIDGHHRHEFCALLGRRCKLKHVSLPNRAAARAWMWDQNHARRNFSPEAKSYIRGTYFNSVKFKHGTNRHTASRRDHLDASGGQTAEILAKRFRVGFATIKRDGVFAKDIDRIAEVCGDDVRGLILSRGLRLQRTEVARLAALDAARMRAIMDEAKTTGQRPKIPADGASRTVLVNFPVGKTDKQLALLLKRLGRPQARKLFEALRAEFE